MFPESSSRKEIKNIQRHKVQSDISKYIKKFPSPNKPKLKSQPENVVKEEITNIKEEEKESNPVVVTTDEIVDITEFCDPLLNQDAKNNKILLRKVQCFNMNM